MLTDKNKQDIRARMAAISKALPGYRSRWGQRSMIAEVARTLGRFDPASGHRVGDTIACIRAGTGVGKSLAYLVPACVLAADRGKKLIVASSTVALQEQLSDRDFPMLMQSTGLKMSLEIAKGRTRYVCNYRLMQIQSDRQQQMDIDAPAASASSSESVDLVALASDFATGRWNGDRDTRPDISDEVWQALTTDRNGCLNKVCPQNKHCSQMDARRGIKDADIVVANHNLVLADLALGGGKILPKPEESFYVIDEAHGFADKAVDAFASNHLIQVSRRAMEKLAALSKPLSSMLGPQFKAQAQALAKSAEAIAQDLGDAHLFLSSLAGLTPTTAVPRPVLEFQDSCLPEEFFALGANIRARTTDLKATLEAAIEELTILIQAGGSKRAQLEKLAADTGYQVSRVEEIESTWQLILHEPANDAPPVAKWVERIDVRNAVDFKLCASPVSAAQFLQDLLWNKAAGVILTSATMTVMGSFDDFRNRTGLVYPGVSCLDVPSPFSYETQGTLIIPDVKASPKNFEAHTAEVTARLTSRLAETSGRGALILFASRRQMDAVARSLPEAIRRQVIVQGEMPKSEIIRQHKAQIERGENSTIMGLDSFGEGVDLPGRYCTLVVVTKLPFPSPDTPVLRALSGWIERRGGNPFLDIFVPDVARKLEQRIGRLIRTEEDHGEIEVLDPRLWDTRYGKAILRGLPPFRKVVRGIEVR